MHKTVLSVLTLLALVGCVNVPSLRQPELDLPGTWGGPVQAEGSHSRLPAPDWWKSFGDAQLDALVEEALTHNTDIRMAAANIEEARANLGMTLADEGVQAQGTVDVKRTRRSQRGSMPAPGSPINDSFQFQLQAAYELDLWGRLREASEAARADLLASEYAREVVRTSLIGDVAQAYFSLRALDAQLDLVEQTLGNRRAAEDLQRLRLEAGVASELDMRQAQAERAALEANRAQLTQTIGQQELALAVLVGRSPRALVQDGVTRGQSLQALQGLVEPPAIPVGLPSQLLQRRPDLRQAEQRLRAAHARIREAKAAVYPDLELSAYLGSESKALANLFSGPAAVWGVGVGIVQSILNGGRTQAALDIRDAQQTQALLAYEQTARQAFREVLDALIVHRQAREQAQAEDRRSAALGSSLNIAELRYRNGLTSYLTVLDAQRNLLQADLNRIEARRAQLVAAASLAKALGGGWQDNREARADTLTSRETASN
ncbi:MAG TPA: efflux transporter outer membrane subunit [Thiobacillaceae bacterium]|nr:efflux transporter outer membrane subunit [Thiobacillaceae bacterium]HNU63196.1 efflux transporter outer membrane subunit [Thiobacillaceae bacterium]